MSSEFDVSKFGAALASMPAVRISVTIGFNTNYAVFVHEILTNQHDVGQAKFLEAAMQQGRERALVETSVKLEIDRVKSVEEFIPATVRGVLLAAEQILGDAQQLTPVLTGALQGSGTRGEAEVEAAG